MGRYIPMLMTPHYRLLFESQHTDLLSLPPLTGTRLGFRSGGVNGAWCWVLIKLRLQWLVDPGLWTLPMVTWSYLGFALVQTSIFLAWSLTAGPLSKNMCTVLSLVSLIIIKKRLAMQAGRELLTPYQSEDPNPTTPTHRMKEEKWKTAGEKKWASS